MRRCRRLFPLLFLIILVGSLYPPAPQTILAKDPATITGVFIYSERGPGASVDGIANALLMGESMPVYTARFMNVFRLLTKLPGISDNPSMKDLNAFLQQGTPDLGPLLPIVADYHADVIFVLEQKTNNSFGLKSGQIHWTNSNNTRIDYDTGNIVDNFHGSSTYTLNPATSSITLTFDLKSKPPKFTLQLNLAHPMPTDGESVWTALEGAAHIRVKAQQGKYTWSGDSAGMPIPVSPEEASPPGDPFTKQIFYTYTGPTYTDYMETWRNLLDGQSFAQFELTNKCTATIVKPEPKAKWVFDDSTPGVLEGTVRAEASPDAFADDLTWTFPEIGGKKPKTDPADARGREVKFRYEGLPAKNSDFGEKEVEAKFTTQRDKCKDPDPQKVVVYFPRDAKNNPEGKDPNWFYYWKQTAAAQGYQDHIQYDPGSSRCAFTDHPDKGTRDVTLGHFDGYTIPDSRDHINICDLSQSYFAATNAATGQSFDGIDLFAAVVHHEWTHKTNFEQWWPKLYLPVNNCSVPLDENGKAKGYRYDCDKDEIPDEYEPGYGLDPKNPDTHNFGLGDEEYLAYSSEKDWKKGSVDKEDWACPGHQAGQKCDGK